MFELFVGVATIPGCVAAVITLILGLTDRMKKKPSPSRRHPE